MPGNAAARIGGAEVGNRAVPQADCALWGDRLRRLADMHPNEIRQTYLDLIRDAAALDLRKEELRVRALLADFDRFHFDHDSYDRGPAG
jgi:hypothetical protein